MKKLILLTLSLLLITTTLFWTACSKTEDEGWTDEDKASYEEVISLQKEVSNNLDEWFLSMDSLDAINMAYQSFTDAPTVSEAFINSQGIAVQYVNGMRGGIFLNPRDEDLDKSSELLTNVLRDDNSGNLKTTVNNRSMILLNPHYYERSHYTDQIYDISLSNLNRVGIDLADFYKNEEATVDRFTELSNYGIIQIYSHGWAYPSETNIEQIYLLTGETANDKTTEKYWSDLSSGNLPIVAVSSLDNKYYISKEFIANHNDFSLDTVMFFGGFCYSFLGDWPDLADSFARGAYLGFDWSVLTFFNANMSVNSMALMSDTSKSQPMNIEAWMDDPDLEKSFWHKLDNRTVHILYAGDSDLTLWGDISVKIITQSSDGKPVSTPGEAGIAYPFKCEVVSDISELEYVWDIGDGSSPFSASNAVNITWSEEGNYVLKVEVKDKSNGNSIGTATADVKIGLNQDVKEYVLSSNWFRYRFSSDEGGITIWDDLISFRIDWFASTNIGRYLVWNGLNFSATETENNGDYSGFTSSISGTLSSDGQLISFVVVQEGYDYNHERNFYFKLTVDNAPLFNFLPQSSGAWYGVEGGQNAQNYVTAFEGRNWDSDGNIATVIGIDWDNVDDMFIEFSVDDD